MQTDIDISFLNRSLDQTAVDKAHAMMIYSSALASKPLLTLELGIGTGLVTSALLSALKYNGIGKLTSVDSCHDFGGEEPKQFGPLREAGVKIVVSSEREFLAGTKDNWFNFLVSDADHGGNWPEEHFRVTAPGALCFFHDTNSPVEYPGLYRIEAYVKSLGYSYVHFKRNSRPDECCHRGLLMVINGK